MKKYILLAVCSLLIASVGITAETTNETVKPKEKTMSTPSISLGYVILYVKDVSASLAFYEKAFGLSRRFYNDDNGKAPLGFEIALVTPDVPALYARAVKAGATVVSKPETKPWGQTVACLRDTDGHIVELCTPLP